MNPYLILATILFVYMSLWYIVSVLKKRNDVADTAWGLGFVLMAWASFFLSGTAEFRGILVCTLVSIWGIRLAWHIHKRNQNKTEDYRYAAWRKAWGKYFYLRSYLQVYLLQGALLFLIALPVLFINSIAAQPLGLLGYIGITIWVCGFYFEARADAELKQFLQNPNNRGTILQTGLWAYSRHPNYFGEVTQWWGLWLIALASPYGWATVIGPITITFLILKVSGVPLLEQKMEQNPAFAEYKQRVSIFFPLPPRTKPPL